MIVLKSGIREARLEQSLTRHELTRLGRRGGCGGYMYAHGKNRPGMTGSFDIHAFLGKDKNDAVLQHTVT